MADDNLLNVDWLNNTVVFYIVLFVKDRFVNIPQFHKGSCSLNKGIIMLVLCVLIIYTFLVNIAF